MFFHEADTVCYVRLFNLCWRLWMFKGNCYCIKGPSCWV